MKIVIDTEKQKLEVEEDILNLYSSEAFEILSREYLRLGWTQKYMYTFSWLGTPIIQLPDDLIRLQEVLYQIQPDVIVETGVLYGGSSIFFASLCKIIGKGRVISVEKEMDTERMNDLERHPLYSNITLIEGNSLDTSVINRVKSLIKKEEQVFVFLDSKHTKKHVLKELEYYHQLVSKGSYLVVADGFIKEVSDTPRAREEWSWNNPTDALSEFILKHPEFKLEEPQWPFNESELTKNVSYFPTAWLKKL